MNCIAHLRRESHATFSGNCGRRGVEISGEKIFRVAGRSRSRCIGRIPARTEVFIKTVQELHVLCANFKVKNIGIFEDASTIGRFGNNHQAMLQCPADENLRR